MKVINLKIFLIFLLTINISCTQEESDNHSYVDDSGVLRWSEDNSEIKGFGVNYTLPFAHSFKMANRMGISHKEAIKNDIYHFARLDFDLYRVHVWDTEISDTLGNLLENEHLDLFDFAVYEMKKRGMKFVITPIAFWGNGWPEKDTFTPGFSHKYGKEGCLVNPDAIEAQANYLNQFLEHINPYTNKAYKDDADVIAFEVSNEPHHGGTKEEVKAYINKMVASMRKTGSITPIFYNMSHSIDLIDAYTESDVQGGTFQWYPTGLVFNKGLKGNFLPSVDNYNIPFAEDEKFKKSAKIVYEFDPADVDANYMYPAMARSFRTAGMQLATHFAYDAMFLAPHNTNYGTHYMNFAYSPQKAISLKIASAVFHNVEMGSDFGQYPENTSFQDFRISYEDDLVEYLGDESFFYSNNTDSKPKNIDELKEICGYGSSELIEYDGRGAYIFDKLDDGVWRLEIMPDYYFIDDPYGPTNSEKIVSAVNSRNRKMTVNLPDLGTDFKIEGINRGNNFVANAEGKSFDFSPGVFIIKNKESEYSYKSDDKLKNIILEEFVAPINNLDTILVKNHSSKQYSKGEVVKLNFEIYSQKQAKDVVVVYNYNGQEKRIDAIYNGQDSYSIILPVKLIENSKLVYEIHFTHNNLELYYPINTKKYIIDIVADDAKIDLWNAKDNWSSSMYKWLKNVGIKEVGNKSTIEYSFTKEDNTSALKINEALHAFKYYIKENITGLNSSLDEKTKLVLEAKLHKGEEVGIEITLIDKSGYAVSYIKKLRKDIKYLTYDLASFKKAKSIILPRPYPDFQPYYVVDNRERKFDMKNIENIQVSILTDDNVDSFSGVMFDLSNVFLE